MHTNPFAYRLAQIASFRALFAVAASLLLVGLAATRLLASDSNNSQETPADLKQLSLEQLGDIEVTTVSKEPVKVSRTSTAIYVITQEDIRRSGATTIPEALRLAPGVEVAQIDSDHWSIAIRGFAGQFSKSLLVLIDGRSVYTPLFSGVYWDVQNLMLEDVDRIEVIRGPGGTIWGANAVNGVINIITKNAKETQGTLATLGGGNVDQGTGGARYGGSVGKDFNYRIYGMGFIRGPEFHSDGDGFDDWRIGQMGFRTDWKTGEHDTFTVQGDIYRGETGERVDIATFSPPAETTPDVKASPNIVSAGIYAPDGRLFAAYSRDRGGRQPPALPAMGNQAETHSFKGNEVLLSRSIVFGSKPAGTVSIQSDLQSLYARVRRYGFIAAAVLATSLVAALLISSVFGKSTAEPIVHLAETARIVSRDKNYSLRAAPAGTRDELDTLIEAFNEMLMQIQERDGALQKARGELEQQVEQRTAQLTSANKELEAFSYSVSHDLRAPLRHIAGFSAILVEDYGPQLIPEAQMYLKRIQDAAANMGRLVDDLLNLARIGRQDMTRKPTDLNILLRAAIKDLEAETSERKIEWRIEDLPTLRCDPGLMKIAIVNLLSNAVKYTRGREPAIIEVGGALRDAVHTIYVRDNGVGFEPKYADKLFGVFQRLHRAEQFEGTGVGLATVQRVIRRHGGEIWAEAQPGKGAAFYFTIQPEDSATGNLRAEVARSTP